MFFLDLVEWEVEVVGQDSLMDLPLNGFQDLADEAETGEVPGEGVLHNPDANTPVAITQPCATVISMRLAEEPRCCRCGHRWNLHFQSRLDMIECDVIDCDCEDYVEDKK